MIQDTSSNPQFSAVTGKQHARLQEQQADSLNQRSGRSANLENEQDNAADPCFCDQLNDSKPSLESQVSQPQDSAVHRQTESNGFIETRELAGSQNSPSIAGPITRNDANRSFGDQSVQRENSLGVNGSLLPRRWQEPEVLKSPANTPTETLDSDANSGSNLSRQAGSFAAGQTDAISMVPAGSFADSNVLGDGASELIDQQATTVQSAEHLKSTTMSSNADVIVEQSPVRFNTETATRTNSIVANALETGRAVSQRVSDVVIQEITTVANNESKHITLHLHPAELGKLTLQVGWEADSIIAKIVASELATSEMLNQDKSWLLDTLQKNGVELDSFDVSHGGEHTEQESLEQPPSGPSTKSRQSDTANTETLSQQVVGSDGPIINLIA